MTRSYQNKGDVSIVSQRKRLESGETFLSLKIVKALEPKPKPQPLNVVRMVAAGAITRYKNFW